MGRLPFVPKAWKALSALAAVVCLIPFLVRNDYFFVLFNIMALNAVVVLGLNVLIGCAGQISLGHAAFFGLGAYSSAVVTTQLGWPLWAGLALALAVTAAFGLCLAVPTLRLEGHYLVMATLGFNIIVSICLNQMEPLTGGPSGLAAIPALHLGPVALDSDRRFFAFAWASFLILFAWMLNLEDSRIGRALKALHDKELTARTLGVPTHRYKVQVFTLSAVLAGFAGFSYAHYMTFISPSTFDIFYSVQVITMVVVGGPGSLWGGLAGTVFLTSLRELLHAMEDFQVLAYGLLLTLSLVYFPQGLLPAVVNLFKKFRASRSASQTEAAMGKALPARSILRHRCDDEAPPDGSSAPVLRVENLSVRFGGLQALSQVSFVVEPEEIVAVIGPNGAGKTTVLNAVSGLVRPAEGTVAVRGVPVTGRSAHEAAAAGVGRTFQTVQIFGHLTPLENIMVGYHLSARSGFCRAMIHPPGERREEETLRRRALALLKGTALEPKAHEPTATLSLYEQKLLEILRALALEPAVLLLDEPVGGCTPNESRALMDWIAAHRRAGMGMVLVEHDMNVVMAYADRVVVLHHGRVIAQGPPAVIRKDPRVIEAYLGTKRRARIDRGSPDGA
ncbi:branched-chain amino acid ABC transporter ATP-binding protein/permease [Desulfosoma sp.]